MTLPKPKAVIFDWDDTIVDNWEIAFKALNTALVHMGMKAWTVDEARRASGPSAKDLFTKLFGDRWQEADKMYYDTFVSLVLGDSAKIHDNAENLLKKLKANGVYMAVVSNKRGNLLRQEIEHIGFKPYFSKLIGAGDAKADKPDPAPILFALEGTGIAPGPDVWYVGDSHTDVIAALKAGCSAILIETKTPPEDLLAPNPPSFRAKDHAAIMELISPHFV